MIGSKSMYATSDVVILLTVGIYDVKPQHRFPFSHSKSVAFLLNQQSPIVCDYSNRYRSRV